MAALRRDNRAHAAGRAPFAGEPASYQIARKYYTGPPSGNYLADSSSAPVPLHGSGYRRRCTGIRNAPPRNRSCSKERPFCSYGNARGTRNHSANGFPCSPGTLFLCKAHRAPHLQRCR
jgi:hypothetical protein